MKKTDYSFADMAISEIIKERNTDLNRINQLVDWNKIEKVLEVERYNNHNRHGNDYYNPLIMFKMLFIQSYYNLSDRVLEEQMAFNVDYRWFCGLMLSPTTPDYSSICRWRNRFVERGVIKKRFMKSIISCQPMV